MQQWEYRFALLIAVPGSLARGKGWKLSVLDEQKLPNWKKTDVYPTALAFCNLMGQQGWELVNIHGLYMSTEIEVYFRRPCEHRPSPASEPESASVPEPVPEPEPAFVVELEPAFVTEPDEQSE
jgi:hypothetical protein